MSLSAKRDELIALHKMYEMVPESPWSPKNPVMKEKLEAGEQLLSERPIAFLCDDEIVVLGDCIGKVVDGLGRFLERSTDYEKLAQHQPAVAQALAKAKRLVESRPIGELRMSQQHWNAILYCLNEIGMHVISTQG